MKVILLRDVAKLGKRFSIITVPDGFALNKLIPQGVAQTATPENVKRVTASVNKQSHDSAAHKDAFMAACSALKTQVITIAAPANTQGHLFKAIKAGDIIASLTAVGITALHEDMITLSEPLKSIGEHLLPISHGEAEGLITLQIISN